jgi:hypothetical protein
MVLPNYYLVSSYKSALCAAMECHLQVSGLFLLFALLSESPSSIAPLMLNSALLLLNAACLPCACAPAALPHASDLSTPCQASLNWGACQACTPDAQPEMCRCRSMCVNALTCVDLE